MTSKDLVDRPVDGPPQVADRSAVERLAAALERLAAVPTAAELELRCFTPEQAAAVLGKTENWVTESIQAGSIPYTRVGKSPRLTAAHIRRIQADGEVLPHKYARLAA